MAVWYIFLGKSGSWSKARYIEFSSSCLHITQHSNQISWPGTGVVNLQLYTFWRTRRARCMLELWGREGSSQRVLATEIKASEFKCYFISPVTTLVRKVTKKNWLILMLWVHHNKTWETRNYFLLKLDRHRWRSPR